MKQGDTEVTDQEPKEPLEGFGTAPDYSTSRRVQDQNAKAFCLFIGCILFICGLVLLAIFLRWRL